MDLFSSFSLHRTPIFVFTLSAIGGVLLALHADLPYVGLFWAVIIALFVSLFSLWRRVPYPITLVLCLLFFGAASCYRATIHLDRDVRRMADAWAEQGKPVAATGKLLYSGENSALILYDVVLSRDSVGLDCRSLRIRVLVDSLSLPDLQHGDLVFAKGKLRPSAAYSPVSVGALIGSLTRREAATLRTSAADCFIEKRNRWSILRTVDNARSYILRTFQAQLSPDGSALCAALILGERQDFSPAFSEKLRLTGLSHLFALSGMNVAFLAGALWILLSSLFIPREIRLWLLLLTILFYMLLGREAPSLVRASLMAACFVVGRLLYRKPQILNNVAAAAFIELLWRPLDIVDAGFLLSYLAVIGILGGYALFHEKLLAVFRLPRNGAALFSIDVIATTAGAQIGTLPLVGYLFSRMPLVGALGNLVAVPGFAVLMLWSVLLLAVQAILPSLAPYVAASIDGLSFLLGKTVDVFAALPLAGVYVPSFSVFTLLCAYLGLTLFLAGISGKSRRWKIAGLFIIANLIVWGSVSQARSGDQSISFISVGNGDAILISDSKSHILIDTGPAFDEWSAAERIIPFLSERNVSCLDAVIFTHPDNDHIGGAQELLHRVPVERIFTNGDSSLSRTYVETMMAAVGRNVPTNSLSTGDRLQFGSGSVMEVLWPDSMCLDDMDSENAKSLVVKYSANGTSALLTADIDSMVERRLVDVKSDLEADLLKTAHHGSKSASCGNFLDAVSPTIAVISAGPLNRFNHPSPAVIERLRDRSIEVYSTVQEGNLTFINVNGSWSYRESPAMRLVRRWKLRHA